jgi:hypothetical protein
MLVVRPTHSRGVADRPLEEIVDDGDGEGEVVGMTLETVQVEEELCDAGGSAAPDGRCRRRAKANSPSTAR